MQRGAFRGRGDAAFGVVEPATSVDLLHALWAQD
jgi:hypothetical protein